MANVANQWIEAISVLTELTQRGRLKWQVEGQGALGVIGLSALGARTPASALGQPTPYVAQYLDKWFRIRKLGPSESMSTLAALTGVGAFKLEIIDSNGSSLFQVPESTGLPDLYKAIQYQLSGVDSVLESLLNERSKRR